MIGHFLENHFLCPSNGLRAQKKEICFFSFTRCDPLFWWEQISGSKVEKGLSWSALQMWDWSFKLTLVDLFTYLGRNCVAGVAAGLSMVLNPKQRVFCLHKIGSFFYWKPILKPLNGKMTCLDLFDKHGIEIRLKSCCWNDDKWEEHALFYVFISNQ